MNSGRSGLYNYARPASRVATTLAAALAIGNCSGLGSGSQPPPADPNLFPNGYRQEVADFLRTYLGNPTKIRDAQISEPALKPVAGVNRYIACVRYNPRDTKNQYMGTQDNLAIFYGGQLNQFLPPDPELCRNAVYQRFPEAEVLVP